MNKITGTIKVINTHKKGVKIIKSTSDFFSSEIYVNNDDINGILTIGKPTPMFDGKTIKTQPLSIGYKFVFYCGELQEIEYEFDDDSNEDEIYIYYREINEEMKKH